MKKVVAFFSILCVLGVGVIGSHAFGEVRTWHVPVIINFYRNEAGDPPISKEDAKAAVDEANRLLRENNMNAILWIVEWNENATAGDPGVPGSVDWDEDNLDEAESMRDAGEDEVDDLENEQGLKISFVHDAEVGGTAQGWAYDEDPVIVMENTGTTARNGKAIAHELGHVLNIEDHSGGDDDIMNETGSGNTYTDEQKEEMETEWNDEIAKCSEQFDEQHPGVRAAAQRGRSTNPRDSGGKRGPSLPEHLDLISTRLRSEDGLESIDGRVGLGGLFSGTVDATYALAFDSDNNAGTGYAYGPFGAMEYALEFQVLGADGTYTVEGIVVDLSDGTFQPLAGGAVTIDTVMLHPFGNGMDPIPGWHRLEFNVPKEYLGLDVTLNASSATEIPVGVLTEESSVIYDTDSFVFYMDRWLRDPFIQTFGNGVPTPGASYGFDISGLQPNDTFNLYLDDALMVTDVLNGSGGYSGSFVFPAEQSNQVAHHLTAQDSSGEFAYNMTCPKEHLWEGIPTMSTAGLIAMAVLLIAIGLIVLRQRKNARAA